MLRMTRESMRSLFFFCDRKGIRARKVCNDCASAAASYRIFGDVILVLIDLKKSATRLSHTFEV